MAKARKTKTGRTTTGRTTTGWHLRRVWRDMACKDVRLTDGTLRFLNLLALRSNSDGKMVWGSQKNMARDLARCERTIGRYVEEAERLGYIQVTRHEPERCGGGNYVFRKSNEYKMIIPPKVEVGEEPTPRRRPRASFCVIDAHTKTKRRWAHRPKRPSRYIPLPSPVKFQPDPEVEAQLAQLLAKATDPRIRKMLEFAEGHERAKLLQQLLDEPSLCT